MQEKRRTVFKGMRKRNVGLNPFDALVFQSKGPEKRRCQRQGNDGRANIVAKSRQCERLGFQSPADFSRRFQHANRLTALRQR